MDGLNRAWMSRPPLRRRGSDIQEELGAEAHPGGKRTRGSGSSSRPSQKGDSVGLYFRQEDKTREKPGAKSTRIQRDDLLKIESEALMTGHQPMFVFGFDAHPPDCPVRIDWAAFPLNVANHMTHAMAALLDGDISKARALASLALGRA